MSSKKQKRKIKGRVAEKIETPRKQKDHSTKIDIHPDVRRYVFVIVFFGLAILLLLASAHLSGPVGEFTYSTFFKLFGWGYFLLPIVFIILAFAFLSPEEKNFFGLPLIGGLAFVFSSLGFMDLVYEKSGGWVGGIVGMLEIPFGIIAAIIITIIGIIISFLITLNRPLHVFSWFKNNEEEGDEDDDETPIIAPVEMKRQIEEPIKDEIKKSERAEKKKHEEEISEGISFEVPKASAQKVIKNYTPPPLDLLSSTVDKPTIGDLHANANIIKRTLESFGIPVEMGEINIGPTVTRYTLKPAEGVKIAKITTLNQDLALALAAHPIRIEAPIPGKSLVGIEVPNKSAAVVRLGSLLMFPEFQKSEGLTFALGRNVNGEPAYPNITKMPHMLVAGSTGSGKSISIHAIIISLLYKNSPEMLKMILIDPKRVELSVYNNLPHLIAPVVTENKKAIGALRWVIQEMDRRYQTLLEAGSRDVKSYNKSASEPLPYILVVIDELADLMQTYGREVEGSIIRLAQMARATGIHMVVSTQRPSVEVITGLIKANITTRIALQVASQIDSRTILDTAGAEKLLGKGDLLYLSSDSPKPKRLQGAFITEEEIKKVVRFIIENNDVSVSGVSLENSAEPEATHIFESFGSEEDGDELLEDAIEVVRSAGKASASLLQRRLKVGYARAARLLDIMEERGIIGPGDGAKPREILIDTDTRKDEEV